MWGGGDGGEEVGVGGGGGGAVDAAPAELNVAASAVLTEGEIKEAIILGYESDNR